MMIKLQPSRMQVHKKTESTPIPSNRQSTGRRRRVWWQLVGCGSARLCNLCDAEHRQARCYGARM